MKRFLACLVAIACLLTAFACALADGESVNMRVIKCSERVNIRETPNTNSTIVGKAPLGAVLVGCQKSVKAPDWYAVVYEGVAGYIRGDFLEPIGEAEAPAEEAPVEAPAPAEEAPVEEPAPAEEAPAEAPVEEAPAEELVPVEEAPAEEPLLDLPSDMVPEYDPTSEIVEEEPIVVDAPLEEAPVEEAPVEEAPIEEPAVVEEPVAVEAPAVVEAPLSADLPAVENAPIASITDPAVSDADMVILDADTNVGRIVARRVGQGDREYLAVAALDADGNQLWMRETATSGITELTLTDAFLGGIGARPLVMLYNAEQGLYALDGATGSVRWLLAKDVVDLGASISYAVGGIGVTYIGGYYGPDPVAIDANGTVLWQSDVGNDDITWLSDVMLTGDGIVCTYDMMGVDGGSGTVVYDYSGNVKSIANE